MGPLQGFRIVEFAGIGPGPMAGMLLSDMGATVLGLECPTASGLCLNRPTRLNFLNRGRRCARCWPRPSSKGRATRGLPCSADAAMREWGCTDSEIGRLRAEGALRDRG